MFGTSQEISCIIHVLLLIGYIFVGFSTRSKLSVFCWKAECSLTTLTSTDMLPCYLCILYPYKSILSIVVCVRLQVPTSKMPSMASANSDDTASKSDEVRHVLSEVNAVKGRQETLTSKLESLKL